jgi:hypothetical protein
VSDHAKETGWSGYQDVHCMSVTDSEPHLDQVFRSQYCKVPDERMHAARPYMFQLVGFFSPYSPARSMYVYIDASITYLSLSA